MPFKTKEKERQWRKDNREYLRKKRKQWERKNPHYGRDWRRKNKGKGLYYWYSEEEKNLIKKLRKNGKSFKEIGKKLNRTSQAIQGKLSQMGIRLRRKWTEKEQKILKEEYLKGKEIKEIADIFNVTIGSVNGIIRKLKIGYKPGTKEFSEKASRRNKKLWNDPNHIFNKPEYKEKLRAHFKDPNHIFNSKEYKQRLSDMAFRNKIWLKSSAHNNNNNKRGYYSGFREDIGHYVRSRWEANISRYLKFLIIKGKIKKYEYEIDNFEFKKIKRGNRSYTPDFKVYLNNGKIEYWEVKGWMDKSSKVKLKRMAKYYPNIKIILIERKEYKEIEKWSRLIPGWE